MDRTKKFFNCSELSRYSHPRTPFLPGGHHGSEVVTIKKPLFLDLVGLFSYYLKVVTLVTLFSV